MLDVTSGIAGLGQSAASLATDLARCGTGDAVTRVNCVARLLYRGGAAGEAIRNSVNSFVSVAARAAAVSQGGSCTGGPRGLEVCIVPSGAAINVRVTNTTGHPVDIPVRLFNKGGTTIGNVFITDNAQAAANAGLLDHELFHTFQWAAAGSLPFAALYGLEYARAGKCNRFEEAADFVKGDYPECVT